MHGMTCGKPPPPPRRSLAWPVVALIALSGCATLSQVAAYPSASIKGVGIEGASFSALTVRFDVEVKNPYGVDLPLVGVAYKLFTEGKLFVEGESPASATIPASGKRIVPVNIRIPYSSMIDAGQIVRPGAEIPYEAELSLKLDAPLIGEITLPLDRDEGTLKVPVF